MMRRRMNELWRDTVWTFGWWPRRCNIAQSPLKVAEWAPSTGPLDSGPVDLHSLCWDERRHAALCQWIGPSSNRTSLTPLTFPLTSSYTTHSNADLWLWLLHYFNYRLTCNSNFVKLTPLKLLHALITSQFILLPRPLYLPSPAPTFHFCKVALAAMVTL